MIVSLETRRNMRKSHSKIEELLKKEGTSAIRSLPHSCALCEKCTYPQALPVSTPGTDASRYSEPWDCPLANHTHYFMGEHVVWFSRIFCSRYKKPAVFHIVKKSREGRPDLMKEKSAFRKLWLLPLNFPEIWFCGTGADHDRQREICIENYWGHLFTVSLSADSTGKGK